MHSLPRVKLRISLGLNIDGIIWDNLHQQLKKIYNNGHVLLKSFYAKILYIMSSHKNTTQGNTYYKDHLCLCCNQDASGAQTLNI